MNAEECRCGETPGEGDGILLRALPPDDRLVEVDEEPPGRRRHGRRTCRLVTR
ncbi:MAG: hypothetical protein MZV64_16565 [Ignavibacteriales bacterium]|nr:hypothetical protein [Ignavibacteriales bacterium]